MQFYNIMVPNKGTKGNPVQFRDGPAAVTGDEPRKMSLSFSAFHSVFFFT
jgi:hypothetical protein